MSKPITSAKPACPDTAASPTTPPAGPDSTASLPRKRAAAVRPPDDCMNSTRASSQPGTLRSSAVSRPT